MIVFIRENRAKKNQNYTSGSQGHFAREIIIPLFFNEAIKAL